MRGQLDWVRKFAAIVLVLSAVTIGIVGLGLVVDGGHWAGILLIGATPLGIWLATVITPEGGTTGYFDRNI